MDNSADAGSGERRARQPWRAVSPEADRLQDAADAAQARFDDLAAIADAEGGVGAVRLGEVAAAQARAWRTVSAARAGLGRAELDGDPVAVAACRADLAARYAEAVQLSRAGLAEIQHLVRAGLEVTGALFDAAAGAEAAHHRVTRLLGRAASRSSATVQPPEDADQPPRD
jgi:hypothetical protein